MIPWEDPTSHPGCERERGADGHHRAEFCIFCLRARGDRAEGKLASLRVKLFKLDERVMLAEDARDLYDDVRDTLAGILITGELAEEPEKESDAEVKR